MIIAVIRTLILYTFIVVGIRLMGKRQVGELEPSELVFALIVSDLASVPMQEFGVPLLSGIIPILTLFCVTMILSILTMRSIRFRALLCGRPSVIVADGKLRQKEMYRNRFTLDELMEELRMQGVADLRSVKYAILETNGRVSVLLNSDQLPVTAAQMECKTTEPGLPTILINDGRLLTRNMKFRGLNEVWLEKQLHAHHIHRAEQVFLLTVDEENRVCLFPKEEMT
jgi:uncharacterized membrane protein YcaP (DUF421 family)